jgi:hypothetical protein
MPIPTPLGDFFGIEDVREMERNHSLLFEDRGDVAMQSHRERPYSGQWHTEFGARGKTLVAGLTMRDVADCIARGLGQTLKSGATWTFDEHAMVINAGINIEKMMGIYPNLRDKPGSGERAEPTTQPAE